MKAKRFLLLKQLTTTEIRTPADRNKALTVLKAVYRDEKGWLPDIDQFLPVEDIHNPDVVWFLTQSGGKPIGLTRVLYKIPFDLYQQYGFELETPGLDVEEFMANNKIAEVGRFAVLPEYRDRILVAAALMRAAATETVRREYTHFITDVFEEDPNSPYGFHSRVLGFKTVATHEVGELQCKSRRITMLLDIKEAFQRLRVKRNWIFRYITKGWNEKMTQSLSI